MFGDTFISRSTASVPVGRHADAVAVGLLLQQQEQLRVLLDHHPDEAELVVSGTGMFGGIWNWRASCIGRYDRVCFSISQFGLGVLQLGGVDLLVAREGDHRVLPRAAHAPSGRTCSAG
jgi:hypothetical protein